MLLLLVALPFIANAAGESFYIALASRILIFALAATSLNLILGFGGMVSFGHAAFVGVGAYSVAILTQMGITDAWLLWPAAMVVSAVFALLIGAHQPAHARRVLHHDHAGLCPDDLLPHHFYQSLWR